jgi:ferredoxin
MREATIDRDLCIGSGNCCHFAPKIFSLDAEGIATAAPLDPGDDALVEVAIAQCPTGAISISDR